MKINLLVPAFLAIAAFAGTGFAYLNFNKEPIAELVTPVVEAPLQAESPLPPHPEISRAIALCRTEAKCWREFAELEWALAQMEVSPYRKAVSEKTCKNSDDLKCWQRMFTVALAMNDAAEAMSHFDSTFKPVVSTKTP